MYVNEWSFVHFFFFFSFSLFLSAYRGGGLEEPGLGVVGPEKGGALGEESALGLEKVVNQTPKSLPGLLLLACCCCCCCWVQGAEHGVVRAGEEGGLWVGGWVGWDVGRECGGEAARYLLLGEDGGVVQGLETLLVPVRGGGCAGGRGRVGCRWCWHGHWVA